MVGGGRICSEKTMREKRAIHTVSSVIMLMAVESSLGGVVTMACPLHVPLHNQMRQLHVSN